MMRQSCLWYFCEGFLSHPSLGALMDLCDENYLGLRKLAPELPEMHGSYVALDEAGIELHLEVMEQTRFTSLIQLTYHFYIESGPMRDPDAVMRVYHDSRQVEVLEIRGGLAEQLFYQPLPMLEQKWRVNLFLSKWLAYCLRQGHRFSSEATGCKQQLTAETTA